MKNEIKWTTKRKALETLRELNELRKQYLEMPNSDVKICHELANIIRQYTNALYTK